MRLEDLPNEILLGIIVHLSLYELYRSLNGLNQRLNDVIQSIHSRALRLRSSVVVEDRGIIEFFSGTVVALEIYDESQVNLADYSKIQSLTYTYATDHQLEHLLQFTCCHRRLVHLDITSDDLSILAHCMLPNQFSSLLRLILRNIDSILTCPWRLTPTIRSIHACSDENFIPSILCACPSLKHLSLFIFESWKNSSLTCIVHHPQLRDLTMEIVQPGWTVQSINSLFSSIETPHLSLFSIRCHQPSLLPFDFVQLADLFTQRVPHLDRFECDLQLSLSTTNIDLEAIGSVHPDRFNRLRVDSLSHGLVRVHTDPSTNERQSN